MVVEAETKRHTVDVEEVHDSCHGRVIRNKQNLYPKFLLLP